jgi:hypothetical protein
VAERDRLAAELATTTGVDVIDELIADGVAYGEAGPCPYVERRLADLRPRTAAPTYEQRVAAVEAFFAQTAPREASEVVPQPQAVPDRTPAPGRRRGGRSR